MEVGTIAEWKVVEGASFGAGDVLAEVETDKATVSFESQDGGVLAKVGVGEGEPVQPANESRPGRSGAPSVLIE